MNAVSRFFWNHGIGLGEIAIALYVWAVAIVTVMFVLIVLEVL